MLSGLTYPGGEFIVRTCFYSLICQNGASWAKYILAKASNILVYFIIIIFIFKARTFGTANLFIDYDVYI